ncbi:MAG: WD40/YVTN/BNR-like repeat-containing protein, partial [Rhodanobacteraceae bacterium]
MNKARHVLTALAALGLLVGMTVANAAAVPAQDLTGALKWRSLGPYLGGRVTSVAGVASEPNLFYAAYAGGGVWKTDDYGKHWKNISDKYFTSNNVGAIAVAPSNPKVIYAGTGDPAIRNTFLTGDGMFKSTDGGKTWKHIGLEKTHVISWIVVDPHNPDVVYVAAMGHVWAANPERGVYKSIDGGKSWKKILFVNDKTGAITLAMDPSNPKVLYATMWEAYRRPWTFSSGGPGSGIYKTTDGGATWTNISHSKGLPGGIFGKVSVAVAPSNPKVVYALIQAKVKPGKPGGLYRSQDGGQSWKLINDSLKITQRAFYYMRVYVDPKDANTIYLPNVGVYVSHDGGKKLTALHPPHGDNHAFWINPEHTNILIEGNDGGAAVSLNAGKSWSSEHNQPTGQFYHANLDKQFPFHIYGAQQDRGSVESASAVPGGGIPGVWHSVIGGEMSWVVPKPDAPWVSYGSGYYSKQWKENRRLGLVTNVSAWPAYKFGLKGAKIKYRYGWWHHAVVTVPNKPKELLVGANVLLKTTDEGIHWKEISPDLTRNDKSKQQRPGGPISADVTGEEMFGTISTIGVSPLNDKIIWTGSDDGLVYVTQDGGAHWNQVRPPKLPEWSTITAVEPSHTDPGGAFVSASRFGWDDFHPYVYKTTDYGKHWTEIISGLPDDQYVLSVRQDPDQSNLLFVATSSTVYMSLDSGAHWRPLTLNLPTVRVTDIAIQPEQHTLVIATFGRAFWALDNLQFLEQLSSARVASDASYLFKPQQTWLVTRRSGGFGSRTRTGNSGQNLPAGVTVFYHLP